MLHFLWKVVFQNFPANQTANAVRARLKGYCNTQGKARQHFPNQFSCPQRHVLGLADCSRRVFSTNPINQEILLQVYLGRLLPTIVVDLPSQTPQSLGEHWILRSTSRQTLSPGLSAMDPWRQGNMGFVPHQGQPNTLSTLSQPRRPLAINDMLNHGPTPPRHRDARSEKF